jgi:hypothetical protein
MPETTLPTGIAADRSIDRSACAHGDAADPLAGIRERFALPEA